MNRWWSLGPALLAMSCSGAGDEADNTAVPVALVTLAPAVEGASGQQITLYGAAEPGPAGKLSLTAPAEAKVVAIDAPAGTPVRAGQIVARLAASSVTRADAAKAAGDAAAADKSLARALRLRGDGLMSDADVETARAAAASADALRASFATRTGDLTLRAPAAGLVETLAVAVGDLLPSGAAVATVARIGDVRARFGIDPDSARAIRAGMPLRIAGVAARAPLTVPVVSVSPVVDPQTKLASVFARIPGNSGIVAGQTLTATVDVAGAGAGVSIPYAALLDDGGQGYVFVVANGVAHRRNVDAKPAAGDRATILSGVRAGERVVTEGGTAVEDGMKVRVR